MASLLSDSEGDDAGGVSPPCREGELGLLSDTDGDDAGGVSPTKRRRLSAAEHDMLPGFESADECAKVAVSDSGDEGDDSELGIGSDSGDEDSEIGIGSMPPATVSSETNLGLGELPPSNGHRVC